VIPGETGILVPAGQPAGIGAAIDRLLDDPVFAGRLARNGQQMSGGAFDPERLGEVLDEVYSGTLAHTHQLPMAG
jgi:glycosyltransferase involved in cell wall biosynthesis